MHGAASKRSTLLDGLPRHRFAAILADPPWFFRTRTAVVSDRDPRLHYKGGVWPVDAIAALPVSDVAARDAHLFLWTTGPFLPKAFEVIEAWGFRYSGIAFVWIKLRKSFNPRQCHFLPTDFHVGLGYTTRKNAEFVLLGRRGNSRREAKDVRELVLSPRREHSRKPEEVRERIERYCAGPYLELFARSKRRRWTCVGDEVGKYQ